MKINLGFVINKPHDEVILTFIDPLETPNWLTRVKEVKLVEGIRNTKNAKYKMIFPKREVKQVVQDIDLPNKIVYHYPELKRTVTHKFRGHDEHTHYNIQVHYQASWFKQLRYIILRSKLIENITNDITLFKEYVENK